MPFDLSPAFEPYRPTSAQDCFDYAARHLLTQGRKSKKCDFCAYRGDGGSMCAAGPFFADDEVREGIGIRGFERIGKLPGRLVPYVDLLSGMQQVHDSLDPELWPAGLKACAKKHGLSAAVLEPAGVAA